MKTSLAFALIEGATVLTLLVVGLWRWWKRPRKPRGPAPEGFTMPPDQPAPAASHLTLGATIVFSIVVNTSDHPQKVRDMMAVIKQEIQIWQDQTKGKL